MIISLKAAKDIDKNIDQSDLDALETLVRKTTRNPFIDASVQSTGFVVSNGNTLTFTNGKSIKYLRGGDTVMLAYTSTVDSGGKPVNDGLYIVDSVQVTSDGQGVVVIDNNGRDLFNETHSIGLLAKVFYPDDVIQGVKKLIKYNLDTMDHAGLKSKTVARVTESYVDVNANDNSNGYPKALMGFLRKYTRLRW